MSNRTAIPVAGPAGYPLIGHLPDFLRDRLGFLSTCAAEYGDVVRLKIGEPTYLLNNAEDIKHVLVINADNYDKSPRLTSTKGKRLSGAGLLTSVGSEHRRQRRMMQPVFHRNSIETFGKTITDNTYASMDRWKDGEEMNICDEMMNLSQRVIIETLFGSHPEDITPEFGNAITTRRKYMERVFFSPFPEFLPSRIGYEYGKAIECIDSTIDRAIQLRRSGTKTSNDLLSMLMQTTYEDGTCMSDSQLKDEARTLLITGYETIGEALAWTWYLLAQHPNTEAKLHAELHSVLNGRVPQIGDIADLRYTAMVLAESMRLYPPTWIFVRMARKDDILPSGAMIPGGSKLYLCQYVVHRNPRYFPDPDRFDPERFSETGKRDRPQFAYFPFGGGPRLCIGDSFARMEGAMVLAGMAQHLRLELVPGQIVVPEPRMTLRAKHGIRMHVHQRADVHGRDT